MSKLQKSHVLEAVLAVASVLSLFGATLTSVIASPANWVDIFSVKPVHTNVWWEATPGGIRCAFPGPICLYVPGRSSQWYNSWGRGRLHVLMKQMV